MKHTILKHLFLAITLILGLISCEDREIITIDKQNDPIVMDLSKDHLYLDQNFPDNPALTVTWEAAKYTVPTAITYRIETSADESFKLPNALTTITGSGRTASFTVDQMNTAATSVGLSPGVEGKMYMRVVSYLGTSQSLISVSNVTSLFVTPYVLSYPDFYLVGAASYVGWNEKGAQQLYKKDNLSYIYTYLQPGNFRFLGQKDWNPLNYSVDDPGIKEGYRYFKQWASTIEPETSEKENMKFNGTAGIYKVVINADAKVKSLDIVPSPIPTFNFDEIYIVGSLNGWNEKNPLTMTKIADGEFEYTTTLDGNTEFKILGRKSWGDLAWGNISSKGYSGFLGPKGDNDNITFNGDGSSSYKIKVNLKAGIYSIEKV